MLYRKYLLSVGHVALTVSLVANAAHAQTTDEIIVLDPIIVEGADDDALLESFDGYTAEGSSTATRIPTDLRTTPRSVTVIGQQQLEDQGVRTLDQALSYGAGVTAQTFGLDGRYDTFALRGFQSNTSSIYRDGMPLRSYQFAAWRVEPFMLDRIDVVRGPTADLYGSNEPGGVVNAVTKRPEFEDSGEVAARAFDQGGGEIGLDFTGPLSNDVAYRAIGVFNQSGTVFDEVDQGRILFAPSVTWRPSDQAKLTVFGQYQKDEVPDSYALVPAFGSIFDNPLGQFDNDFYTGDEDFNTIETEQSYLGYELEQSLGSNLKWLSRARIAQNDWTNDTSFPGAFVSQGGVDPAAVDGALQIQFEVEEETDQLSFDNSLQTELTFGDTAVTLVGGVDYYQADITSEQLSTLIGLRDLDTGALIPVTVLLGTPGEPATLIEVDQEIRQTGMYATALAEIGSNVVLNGGVRYDFIDISGTNILSSDALGTGVFTPSETSLDNEQEFTSASIGSSYNFQNGATIYGNAARSFNLPPSGADEDSNALDVEDSLSFEIGARFQPVGTGSLFSVAAFDITKQNVAQASTSIPGATEQIGEVESQGVELSASHAFTNGISVLGSYTYTDTTITQDAANEGNMLALIPEHAATAWVNYAFQDDTFEGLRIGAGARFVGERFSDNENTADFEVPDLVVFDASASYQFGDWNASLAIQNIADEVEVTYCDAGLAQVAATVPGATGRCAYSAGRSATLSLTRTF